MTIAVRARDVLCCACRTHRHHQPEVSMNKIIAGLSLSLFLLAGNALADDAPAAGSCEAKAVGKDGKPLAGAAKASFIKKCEKGEAGNKAKAECETKAVSKDGKPLAGAAKSAFVKKCVKDAGKPAK
jgi:hypothetical protein